MLAGTSSKAAAIAPRGSHIDRWGKGAVTRVGPAEPL